MNTYMVHMLERAREVHNLNGGNTCRDSKHKCPFCVADEDEAWMKAKFDHAELKKNFTLKRPTKSPPPHCENCPLINVMHKAVGEGGTTQGLMDDCVPIGTFLLREIWEDSENVGSF